MLTGEKSRSGANQVSQMAGDFCTFCANRFARQSDRIPKGFYDKSSDELSSDASNSRLIGEPNEESLLAGSDFNALSL